jgi:inorganic pyrophosphatase
LDHKVLSVALGDPEYVRLDDVRQLPKHRLAALRRFFLDYKTLEGKEVEVEDFEPAAKAHAVISDSLRRYRRSFPAQEVAE